MEWFIDLLLQWRNRRWIFDCQYHDCKNKAIKSLKIVHRGHTVIVSYYCRKHYKQQIDSNEKYGCKVWVENC